MNCPSLFDAPDAAKRVLIAGTYNGHPMPMFAAIATTEKLIREWYRSDCGAAGSASCTCFMDHAQRDWHDITECCFRLPTKQGSVSATHSEADIELTLDAL
jgi:glutamate-1-semialdehyde 2,1-aminomutase